MAQNNLTFVCLLLVLIFCQEIQSIEARNLKHEREEKTPKLEIYNNGLEKEAKKINPVKNANLHGDEYATAKEANASNASSPTEPSVVVGLSTPPPPRHVDDFRPTAPGHSPGVGHSLQN